MTADSARIRFLEERSLNVWPGLGYLFLDGWIVQYSAGYSRRGNSAHPLFEANLGGERTSALRHKIQRVEDFYRRMGVLPRFKMTSAALPVDLQPTLETMGYAEETGALVMTRPAPEDAPDAREDFIYHHEPTEGWIEALLATGHVRQEYAAAYRGVTARIAFPAAYGTVLADDQVVSVGVAVAEDDQAGIFSVATIEENRGRGFARAVMDGLTRWAADQGARTLWLQVRTDNERAIRFYEKLGFREEYRYWYMVKKNNEVNA